MYAASLRKKQVLKTKTLQNMRAASKNLPKHMVKTEKRQIRQRSRSGPRKAKQLKPPPVPG